MAPRGAEPGDLDTRPSPWPDPDDAFIDAAAEVSAKFITRYALDILWVFAGALIGLTEAVSFPLIVGIFLAVNVVARLIIIGIKNESFKS